MKQPKMSQNRFTEILEEIIIEDEMVRRGLTKVNAKGFKLKSLVLSKVPKETRANIVAKHFGTEQAQ